MFRYLLTYGNTVHFNAKMLNPAPFPVFPSRFLLLSAVSSSTLDSLHLFTLLFSSKCWLCIPSILLTLEQNIFLSSRAHYFRNSALPSLLLEVVLIRASVHHHSAPSSVVIAKVIKSVLWHSICYDICYWSWGMPWLLKIPELFFCPGQILFSFFSTDMFVFIRSFIRTSNRYRDIISPKKKKSTSLPTDCVGFFSHFSFSFHLHILQLSPHPQLHYH